MAQAVQRFPILGKLTRMAHVSPVTAFGIRYATAVSAAIWLGHAPGLVENQSKWILITVCVVMQPIAGGSLLKAILRAFGTLVAFFTSILVFGLFSQDPPLLQDIFWVAMSVTIMAGLTVGTVLTMVAVLRRFLPSSFQGRLTLEARWLPQLG